MEEGARLSGEKFTVEAVRIGRRPLPLLAYRKTKNGGEHTAEIFEDLFERNGWPPAWRNGVYSFHHFHSTAHEVLGVYAGRAAVVFGGEDGVAVELRSGDAVLIPAGIAHCLLNKDAAFQVVGAYPAGQVPDLIRGVVDALPEADRRSRLVALPEADPLLGSEGGIFSAWTFSGEA